MTTEDRELSLKKLETLTKSIPSLAEIVKDRPYVGVTEYKAENGVALSFSLYHGDSVAVARKFITAGGMFPIHQHSQREWLIVTEGDCVVECSGKEMLLALGDSLIIEANQEHTVRAISNVWMVAVTVPASSDFPYTR